MKIQTVMKDDDLKIFNPITEQVIGCAYTVSNVLGCGFHPVKFTQQEDKTGYPYGRN
jgi:hypothetical protein